MTFVSSVRRAAAAAFLLLGGAASAQGDPSAAALAAMIKPLLILPSDSGASWDDLEKDPAIRWGAGPVMLDKASPDGNFFARPGQATVAGRALGVIASGARSVVVSVYIRDPAPPIEPEALVASFRRAGFAVVPARCLVDPRASAPRRWYRLSLAKKKPAFLYSGPLQSGGSGYTLFLNDLPPAEPGQTPAAGGRCPG